MNVGGLPIRAARMLLRVALAAAVGHVHAETPPSSVQRVPVTIDGERIAMEMRIHKPAPDGRFPTLVFNHGSTGYGTDTRRFTQPVDAPAVAAFFVEHGWAVVMPARRGRAGTEGLYDEGFSTIRALGYSCMPSLSLAGADRALRGIEAAMAAILEMPFVDTERIAIASSGKGTFQAFVVPSENGHGLPAFPATWAAAVEAYLQRVAR